MIKTKIIETFIDESTNLIFTIDGTILGVSENFVNFDLIIPSFIILNGKKIKIIKIGDNAFKNIKLTSLSLPDSIISIGDNAFLQTDQTLKKIH